MYRLYPYCKYVNWGRPRTLIFAPQVNSKITWEQICEWSERHEASRHFKIGDEINDTLKNGEKVVFVVVGKNMYQTGDVIFGLKDCLARTYPMNKTNTNQGGWNDSTLKRILNYDILNLLPDALQACIRPRMIGGQASSLWLFSEMEIFGNEIWWRTKWADKDDDGGIQMPYFKRASNRLKGRGKDGFVVNWWERSAASNSNVNFCMVDYDADAFYCGANFLKGVAFGFCV